MQRRLADTKSHVRKAALACAETLFEHVADENLVRCMPCMHSPFADCCSQHVFQLLQAGGRCQDIAASVRKQALSSMHTCLQRHAATPLVRR